MDRNGEERENGFRTQRSLRAELEKLAEPDYQKFSAHLLPPDEQVLGVRLPALRKIARRLAAEEGWQDAFSDREKPYFEEVMLHGMVIGYLPCGPEERLSYIRDFIPLIHNWSVCDSFCAGLRFTAESPQNKERVWQFLQPYFRSGEEYAVRFACVMVLNYYTETDDLERDLAELDQLSEQPYYASMAVAWAISMLYVRHPRQMKEYLGNSRLDDATYARAIRKILESRQIQGEEREAVRALRRKYNMLQMQRILPGQTDMMMIARKKRRDCL